MKHSLPRLKVSKPFLKSQVASTLRIVGQTVSVTTIQLHCWSEKAAHSHGHIPIKLYLQMQATGQIWPRAIVCQPLDQWLVVFD